MLGRGGLDLKSPEQIQLMRRAGVLVGETLEAVRDAVRPGVSTGELDELAERTIRDGGGIPSFIGVPGGPGAIDFPASLCISVNEEIVHGIPGGRVIQPGDVVSVDCGAIVQGWHGDSAITVVVDTPDGGSQDADRALVAATEAAMWHGIAALQVGGRLFDVGAAVEDYVGTLATPYGIVEEYVGHGIGRSMHEDPQVPNYRVKARGPKLSPGACLAVEPMLTAGSARTRTLGDNWTVVTADGGRAAHWEHSVAVTERGPWVLTALDGGVAGLASVGVTAGVPA